MYLWVRQAGVVGFEVVHNALHSSGQRGSPDQQNKQHDVWEGGRQVHHLVCTHSRWRGSGVEWRRWLEVMDEWSGSKGSGRDIRKDWFVMSPNTEQLKRES